MSIYRENYRGVSGGEFELMPEGEYEVKVVNSTISPAKSSGKDTWCLEFEIVGPKYAGRKLWLYHGMSEEARPMRKGTITSLGLNPENDNDLIDDVKGLRAKAIVYHDRFDGQKKEKIKRLRSLDKTTAKEQAPANEFESGEVLGGGEDGVPF